VAVAVAWAGDGTSVGAAAASVAAAVASFGGLSDASFVVQPLNPSDAAKRTPVNPRPKATNRDSE
jgi:hypothetical protein